MTFVLENLRLRDLVAIVRQNQAFHDEFVRFLATHRYRDVHAFVKRIVNPTPQGGIESNVARLTRRSRRKDGGRASLRDAGCS